MKVGHTPERSRNRELEQPLTVSLNDHYPTPTQYQSGYSPIPLQVLRHFDHTVGFFWWAHYYAIKELWVVATLIAGKGPWSIGWLLRVPSAKKEKRSRDKYPLLTWFSLEPRNRLHRPNWWRDSCLVSRLIKSLLKVLWCWASGEFCDSSSQWNCPADTLVPAPAQEVWKGLIIVVSIKE